MLGKSLESLTESDLRQAVANRVPEGKQLEYKEVLPGNDHGGNKEFLADVSAMANAAGGLILYGIAEERDNDGKTTGLPAGVPGLAGVNLDREKRRLENLLRDGVKPRIQGAAFREIPLSNGSNVLGVRIPQSWNPPHVVDLGGHWRFYIRNSSGKHPMDVDEVRLAMTFGGSIVDSIRNFRLTRLAKIASGETPVRLVNGPKIILHLLPLSMVAQPTGVRTVVLTAALRETTALFSDLESRINMDGVVSASRWDEPAVTYVQLFRSGAFEYVGDWAMRVHPGTIDSFIFEKDLVDTTRAYLSLLPRLELATPIVIAVSLLGVRGLGWRLQRHLHRGMQRLFDRDDLIVPDTLVEDLESDTAQLLKPSFDIVWNAFGLVGSQYYDQQGRWTGDDRCQNV